MAGSTQKKRQYSKCPQPKGRQPKGRQPKGLSLLCCLSFSFETGSQVSQAGLKLSV
ncbi:rCG63721 [Rattus norvegicus]|uniref:RCG63721 n=1 Tax=Rattus norvegicus TaxID=10116 RepID=A6I935_RAT|nr:rCG63721 [Rattus norvegicus]